MTPGKIVETMDFLEKGMKIADFGCGHGYFTMPLASKAGDLGKVYAIDVMQESVDVITSKAKMEGLNNIEVKRGNLEKEQGSGIEDNTIDVIWMANLLFQTEKDENIINEAKRILKDNGNIVFIDWKPDAPLGPQGKRVNEEEVINLFQKAGFTLNKDFETDNYHFGLIFKK
jgi:ubiquinone/menaquinone biosynthesis C-methylase UbiE